MGSKLFLYIIILVNVLLILRMITGRRAGRPTPLEISKSEPSNQAGSVPAKPPPAETTSHPHVEDGNLDRTSPGFERSLNLSFMFNGHSFDAYEVLGLPAGSSKEACLRAALDLRRKRPKDGEFLDVLVAAVQGQIPG